MTLSSTYTPAYHAGNDVTTTFPFGFRVLEASHLKVVTVDPNGVETEISTYTATGAGSYNGGSVILPAPLPTGWHISIKRRTGRDQGTEFRGQGAFFEEIHEDAFDKLTMIQQEQQEQIDRAFLAPKTGGPYDFQIPPMVPGYALGVNAEGDGLVMVPNTGADQSADLADTTSAVKGAGRVGFTLGLDYPSGSTGEALNEVVPDTREAVAGTLVQGPTNQRVLQSNTESFGPFISRALCTTANMDIFVDPATGDDGNAGTQLAPLATIEAACQRLPQNIYHKVRIYLLDGDYSGQTITLFNYFVSPSGHAGVKIIGHVAAWDGGTHPIYGSDDLDAVVLDGSHVISGVIGTEELTLAGIKFSNSWVEAYNSHVLLYKCKFDGGYTVTGFEPRICLGGHSSIIVAQSCVFANCAAVIDAENFVQAQFDTCSVSGMIDSPEYPGTYGCPIKANNCSTVYVKSCPTFWTAGVAGKKNVAINGGRIHGQNPYSEGVGGVNYIRREDGAQGESVHIDGGAGTAPGQGTGGGFTAYGKNASGNNGKALVEFGTSVAAIARVQHIPASLTPTVCMDWNANGDTIPYGYVHQKVGANVASATTIAPTGQVFHVTGTTAIATISLPFTGFKGTIILIPDAAFTTTTADNIGIASTAVIGKALHMTFDGTKWYPSY